MYRHSKCRRLKRVYRGNIRGNTKSLNLIGDILVRI